MSSKTTRLFFIDAMRAWAILMMLQGHFVDGLLDNVFRDASSTPYQVWKYFRGITAPVFFTVSGFIFTYLLIRVPQKGFHNPRVKKGLRRGLQLILIGYLLRLNIFGLFKGQLYGSFFLVDVLHIIGLSLIGIITIYLITYKNPKYLFPGILITTACLLFAFEPVYKTWEYSLIPDMVANYFTRANGSVFTIIPWFGYTALGSVLSIVFTRFKDHKYVYTWAIPLSALAGFTLIFYSSPLFVFLYKHTGLALFNQIYSNNYLFIRMGDVLVVFAAFMLIRNWVRSRTVLRIGQNTLSIYVIHFVILYGSFTGMGLYRFFHHSLNPTMTITGALVFMVACSYSALLYEKHEAVIKRKINQLGFLAWTAVEASYFFLKAYILRVIKAKRA
ncbi:acyltransferase family protein [Lentiprolixibacter aurantiacus]|uniref:Heparan-alpha-glucosaminide N-acetyltransferase domain-containing protein n=1 Tax=Lentiprolixibacter aurantiacus TaxID=2993939 RepID=A0AAE3ML23_9FLAO|nr:acyltransferase family protein [Lentiprolixibacter aurantiacus]MCX2719735.1 heparan-alpha-glucosaminide N-acetyltransferase domain-containing protein [Lentiprolixibacter aurantiacus]